MGEIRFGPSGVPSRETPEAAVELLLERGYSACEIDFASGFWMDYPWAERFGELAREADIALSVHAPIAGFMGHLERDRKYNMATGMLDHSADIAYANRNETKHLPYGEGTLRAEPLRDALPRFDRPATVISESPGEASSQAIKGVLLSDAAARR